MPAASAALEAAFVNYGDERAGFLPLDEVNFKVLPVLQGREGHRRGRITDHLASGKEITAWVYLYRGDVAGLSALPGGRWVAGQP